MPDDRGGNVSTGSAPARRFVLRRGVDPEAAIQAIEASLDAAHAGLAALASMFTEAVPPPPPPPKPERRVFGAPAGDAARGPKDSSGT